MARILELELGLGQALTGGKKRFEEKKSISNGQKHETNLDLCAYFDFVHQIDYFAFEGSHSRDVLTFLIEFHRIYTGK